MSVIVLVSLQEYYFIRDRHQRIHMGRYCYECLRVHLYVWLMKFCNVTVFRHSDTRFWVSLSLHGFPWDITVTRHPPDHRVGEVSRNTHEYFKLKGLISIGFYLLLRLILLSSGYCSEVFLVSSH